MHPFNKPISELVLTDITALIDNGIPEGRTLDYKRDLYGTNDAEKKEFLCDVSAFANTVGGYLIIGVDEDKGVPTAINPVVIDNVDKLKLLFENLLRTAVDPAIRRAEFKPIDTGDGKYVLVIDIPRSISRPHAVNHRGHWRFYGRNSIGKYPYEVGDVRRAMLESETLAVKIRNFRNDRLSQISVGETPVPLIDGAKIVLHIMPASAFEFGHSYDLNRLSNLDLPPLCAGGWDHRLNFDGAVTYLGDRETGYSSNYTQVFRSGIVEAVDNRILQERDKKGIIFSKTFAPVLIEAMNKYLSGLIKLGVDLPLWLGVSLLGVKGYLLAVDYHIWGDSIHPIDRHELIVPEIRVEDTSIAVARILRPAFDSIANACGFRRWMSYDE